MQMQQIALLAPWLSLLHLTASTSPQKCERTDVPQIHSAVWLLAVKLHTARWGVSIVKHMLAGASPCPLRRSEPTRRWHSAHWGGRRHLWRRERWRRWRCQWWGRRGAQSVPTAGLHVPPTLCRSLILARARGAEVSAPQVTVLARPRRTRRATKAEDDRGRGAANVAAGAVACSAAGISDCNRLDRAIHMRRDTAPAPSSEANRPHAP